MIVEALIIVVTVAEEGWGTGCKQVLADVARMVHRP